MIEDAEEPGVMGAGPPPPPPAMTPTEITAIAREGVIRAHRHRLDGFEHSLDLFERAVRAESAQAAREPFDHSTLERPHWYPHLGQCVCDHCARLAATVPRTAP